MSGLNKAQHAQVRSLMKDERWDALIKFSGMKLDQWREQKISGNDAFQELRALHTRDGKVEGLLEFLDQLERNAFDN